MVITIKDGGSAFPFVAGNLTLQEGMTLRQYYAGEAMKGLLANPGGPVQANGMHGWGFVNCTVLDVVGTAYEIADAMLAAREVPNV